MNKRTVILLIVAGGLLTVSYVLFYSDSSDAKNIQVFLTHRQTSAKGPRQIIFTLDKTYKVDSIRFCRAAEWQTNKFAHGLWHIVARLHPMPVAEFMYGQNVPGMDPSVPGAKPEPLEPGVKYTLCIQAGPLKTEKVFTMP